MPNIHADITQRAFVNSSEQEWAPSPVEGVSRRYLEREGDEEARCATIVRFAPGKKFTHHAHGLGEEFFIMDGVFSDHDGDFKVGTYCRNPPGTSHEPWTNEGCVLFVRLRQMRPTDPPEKKLVIDTNAADAMWSTDPATGAAVQNLYANDGEAVTLVKLPPNTALPPRTVDNVEESLVTAGSVLVDGGKECPAGAWLRVPAGGRVQLTAGAGGCTLLHRVGRTVDAPVKDA